jgi:hypothetical protein
MLPRWLITFRAFALACAFAAAFVPIATYITDDKRDWLWIHIGVNIAAYIAVALTTIYTTVNLTQQDHNKFSVPAYWANNVVMRTWYLGVSKTWRWHVATAVGRLGLALALAQHLNIFPMSASEFLLSDFRGIISQFYYFSHKDSVLVETLLIRSQWETSAVSIIALCVFALLEAGLLAALSCLISTILSSSRKILIVALLRLSMVFGFVVIMSGVYELSHMGDPIFTHALKTSLRDSHRVAFAWLDNGTMMAADFLRPLGNISNADIPGVHYGGWPKEVGNYVYGSSKSGYIMEYDNRIQVLHTVLRAFASYITYFLAIIASLQLAQYLHWRQEQSLTTTPSSTH